MDQLRFGAADAPDTRRVLDGVVRGIGGYGTPGPPNIGGETVFDPCYAGNPLVNALCVGVLRQEDLHLALPPAPATRSSRLAASAAPGSTVMAGCRCWRRTPSMPRDPCKKLPLRRSATRSWEKVLIECCLELYAGGLVIGIQDLGGAGLSCATSELASAGDGGMTDPAGQSVPLRAKEMTPAEVLCSESQERMCAVVSPKNVDAFLAVCRKWEVLATVIGEVTDGDRLQITWHGETVVDVPPRTVAHEGPVYQRPVARPDTQDALNADRSAKLSRPVTGDELRATLLALLGSPHLCSRAFITEQYDRYVRGNTVLAEHADGGMLRIDESTGRGIAVSTDASGRYTLLDPYAGAQLALAEAYRNVAVTGATPVAVTNCLNFGSPEDPGVMWQFTQAVRGLADGCADLGIPVTGGNVSFYNQTGSAAILPTPVVGVLGVIDDVRRRIPTGLGAEPGETLMLLGDTRDEFDGSVWAQVTADHLGGLPPVVDLAREKLLAAVLSSASRDGLVSAAHDLSEGGLAQAIVESALAGETGCRIVLPEGADPFVLLFSESAGRVLVAVPRTEESRFRGMCEARGLPAVRIGVVDQGSDAVEVQGLFAVSLAELRATSEAVLPRYFG
ncbi:phosphoribosylformylglycinamidine synthase subunit PurL [Mycobacterium tuberculosis]